MFVLTMQQLAEPLAAVWVVIVILGSLMAILAGIAYIIIRASERRPDFRIRDEWKNFDPFNEW